MKNRTYPPTLITITTAILCLLFISAVVSSKVVTAVNENSPITDRITFIIDAGHGGVDGGATSYSGILESAINLEIAIRLNDLMHLLGMQTVMTRTTDISVYTEGKTIAAKKVSDLKSRVKTANETENAVLISIHQNYFSDNKYNGPQVFYPNNSVSKDLGMEMQTALVNHLYPESNRKIKKADGIYLMENIHCPGILIECGFLSNPSDDAKLRNPDYQKKLCCVITSVLNRFTNMNTLA